MGDPYHASPCMPGRLHRNSNAAHASTYRLFIQEDMFVLSVRDDEGRDVGGRKRCRCGRRERFTRREVVSWRDKKGRAPWTLETQVPLKPFGQNTQPQRWLSAFSRHEILQVFFLTINKMMTICPAVRGHFILLIDTMEACSFRRSCSGMNCTQTPGSKHLQSTRESRLRRNSTFHAIIDGKSNLWQDRELRGHCEIRSFSS